MSYSMVTISIFIYIKIVSIVYNRGCKFSGLILNSGFFVSKIYTILLIFSPFWDVFGQFHTLFQDFFTNVRIFHERLLTSLNNVIPFKHTTTWSELYPFPFEFFFYSFLTLDFIYVCEIRCELTISHNWLDLDLGKVNIYKNYTEHQETMVNMSNR